MNEDREVQILDEGVERNYEILCKRIQTRKQDQGRVSFLFSKKNEHSFIPDYFVLNEVGKNSFQRFLNKSLSRYAWLLWKNSFLKSIAARLLKPVQNVFKPKILSQVSSNAHSSRLMERWEDAVSQQMFRSDKIFRSATFYEIFLFLTDSLSTLLKKLKVHPDLFLEEKLSHHKMVMTQYPTLRHKLINHQGGQKQLELCLFISSFMNQLDLMNRNLSKFNDLSSTYVHDLLSGKVKIQEILPSVSRENLKRFIDFLLRENLRILFECDNCGEILVDLIFIEILLKSGHWVTVACKEKSILNDVTQDDFLQYLELPELSHLKSYLDSGQLKVIHTGSSIPGKYLFEVPRAYQDCYLNSDCLILKGEGNFQTMPLLRLIRDVPAPYVYKKPIFYALAVKTSQLMHLIRDVFATHDILSKSNIFYYFFESTKE